MYSYLSKILKKNQTKALPKFQGDEVLADAAVLVLFTEDKGDKSIILTKRSEEVARHKGQICFPGGVRDAADPSLWETALRETKEEIGIEPSDISLIGELSPLITPTGFKVYPYVGQTTVSSLFILNPKEIAEVFTLPLSHLLDSKNFQFVKRRYDTSTLYIHLPQELKKTLSEEYDDPLFTYKHYEIWGATGRILVQLVEALGQSPLGENAGLTSSSLLSHISLP